MKKLLLIGLMVIWFNVLIAPPVHAASEFTTSFHSLYTISANGDTQVVHTITLKNNLSHIYATDYSIATSGEQLQGITASDESGHIETTSTIQNGTTTIHLQIDRPAIGLNQVKTLTLSYTTDDVVEKIGATTTINIPRLARANEAQEYTRVVMVEGESNVPKYIYPPASKTEPDGIYTSYTFTGHQNDSLTLLFGDSVTYQLNLTYELKNKELSSTQSELALPPDTPYQKVILNSLTPPPLRIVVDENGNWLARYPLKPQEKLLVRAELFVTVYPVPSQYDPSITVLQKTPHSKYWDTTSATIVDLANRLQTPQNIYGYLLDNFTYNYSGVSTSSRKGALAALDDPTLVLCTEFTDSFVSLTRSLNIPSREINGYGYTKNATLQPQNTQTDILHAWPEYYNSSTSRWVSVDPTWGNTTGGIDYWNKLDFSHIAFVRHGSEDSYPLPAGAYKSDPSDKYIQVAIASAIPTIDNSFEIKDNVVSNTGNVALINDQVGYLPPYGSLELKDSHTISLYDKIKLLCANLLSKFLQLLPASM